ncbi:MAG: hypothetical protein AB1742_09925 [bacterium]
MPVPKLCKALVAFADGSFLFVELSKRIEPQDTVLFCSSVLGLPNGAAADKPTAAVSVFRLARAGESHEITVPMNRVNGVSILEEYIKKEISKDVEELWTEGKAK